MNKNLFVSVIFSFFSFALYAQSSSALLTHVTVFTNGAELTHSAKVTVASGNSEVVIKNISGIIDENTIQVGSNTDLTILSVTFFKEFTAEDTKSSLYQRLQDSLKQATQHLNTIRTQINIQKNALGILDANKTLGGQQTGLQVAELQKLLSFYLEKQREINTQLQELQEKEQKQNDLIVKLQTQINEQFTRRETGKGELHLQVLNNETQQTTFTISYISNQAAWTPMYDLKAKDTKSPLKIIYKGNIVQQTGLDWKNVTLSLSTSNPNQNGSIPVLSTWFLTYYVPQYYGNAYNDAYKVNAMSNSIQSFEAKAPLALEKPVAKALDNFVSMNQNALNVTFDIELDYNIPSDNKVHSVSMKEYNVQAEYKYYCVPKLDPEAFLVAEVSDWESLSLMPGVANIIFDGNYVGKSFIDPNNTQDTLNISLGRDKKIVVKREKVQDFCSSKLIGSSRMHAVTYELKVKNTRKETIQLLLKDQLPVSSQKDIEVQVDEISGASHNTETGILTWKMELAPNETQKRRIQYSVKFPKDKNILL